MALFDISCDRARHLADHYGTAASLVQGHCARFLAEAPLGWDCPYTRGEIDFLTHNEFVVHLSDVVLRRTGLAITGALDAENLAAVVETMRPVLGWSADAAAREEESLLAELQAYHSVPAARLSTGTR